MQKSEKIPKATITRLSLYCRQLELVEAEGFSTISSEKIALLCQVNSAQVRKDLGYFGEFGVRGVGYNVQSLQQEIKTILAVNRNWNMAIVGIGNLGEALLRHHHFPDRGFHFVAAFDSDPEKIGLKVPGGITVKNINNLGDVVDELDINIGVITTPYSGAQPTANRLIESGVRAILNFSSAQIKAPDYCIIENIDFSMKLDALAYKLKNNQGELKNGNN